MNSFPVVDPIPLPAPVWLFKALHIVTLALHFCAVEMLLGGLVAGLWLSFMGRRAGKSQLGGIQLNAAAALSKRLPVVMTYVINLGVPPLLFAQVLYGRALYTSSVLIGFYWIGVIFLLMACYWHIYRFNAKVENNLRAWPMALAAVILAYAIAMIYTTNMTLMLRPEVWRDMYTASGVGSHLPPHDPTVMPRWLFMLVGGLTAAGLWMIWLAGRKTIEQPVRVYLATIGGRLALGAVVIQILLAGLVYRAQSAAIQAGLGGNPVYAAAGYAWLGGAAAVLLLAAWSAFKRPTGAGPGWAALAIGLVTMLAMALYRDGIRDLTLASKGFDVWDRVVVTNWTIVGLFLFLFVAGLVCMGWLVSVLLRAKPVSEKVA
jgi:hypothetical protein